MAPPSERPAQVGRPSRAGRRWTSALVTATAVLLAACSSPTAAPTAPAGSSRTTVAPVRSTTSTTPPGADRLAAVRHIFVIVLENEGYDTTFGTPSNDPYLASTLPAAGALLTQYYGIGHHSLDNYVAMVSGQAPNPLTQADCPQYVDFPSTATVDATGQIDGSGCVYPATVPNVATQLTDAHLTWKAYMQDMGNIPSRESAVCGHPVVGQPDHTETATPGDGYASRHDPFVYFHSIIDNTALCDAHVAPLGSTSGSLPATTPPDTTGLAVDLRSIATTPDLSYITPNLCNDGHDAPCINQEGSASPLVNIDAFLQTWVPLITSSPAFKKDGLLAVTFDEADADGGNADASACCDETPGPAAAQPGEFGPGGGRIGTVVLSPFIKAGTVSNVPYNHYSLLATIESAFGLSRLGQANSAHTFGSDVFTSSG